ncbi:histidine phosphatase family protein [Vibrio sp. PP-XX7]
MTEIHIFRHGETEWNLEGRMQGFLDSQLTTLGRQQAREAKSKLKGLRFDVAYSSTSSRAFETVQILSEDLDLQIYKDEALREINLGVWEGMLHTDVKSKYSTEHENFWSKPSEYKGVGGENFLSSPKDL